MQVKQKVHEVTAATGDRLPIAEALRLIRTRRGLTQTALSKLPGAPDFRTLSHWETRRKLPSLPMLYKFLSSLGLDFRDLQDALDQHLGGISQGLDARLTAIEGRGSETAEQVDRTAEVVAHLEARLAEMGGEISRRLETLEILAGLLPRTPEPTEVEPRENAMDDSAGA